MSLIWPDKEADIVLDQPRLHALVIGVGDYPHLNGGSGTLANDPLGLGQVTTPPVTARKIAEWLLASYSNPACPLGSLEMMISPNDRFKRPDKKKRSTKRVRMAETELAFNRWEKRCSARAENFALLYFCGHGLNKSGQYLLPEDFGDPQWADPWRNCIDFDRLRVGFRSCKAQTQLFFIDACRETPFGMLDQVNVSGQPFFRARFSDSVASSAAYYAAMEGKQAFGPDNDVTYFGQAVLKCLNGTAAKNPNGEWIVTTASLGGTLPDMMTYLGKKHKLVLTCTPVPEGIGVEIHKPAKPYVIATIACKNQPAADSVADIVMKRKAELFRSAVGEPKPMELELEPGDWEIEVTFPGGEFPNGRLDRALMPGIFEGVPLP